ncbi:unnamed protein product [Choristocarpus tenellus]
MSGAGQPPHKIPKVEGTSPSYVPNLAIDHSSSSRSTGSTSHTSSMTNNGRARRGEGSRSGSGTETASTEVSGAGRSMISSSQAVEAVQTRKKGVSVSCPIAYGSLAFWLGKKKQDEFHTHKWTLFVRGPNGEDLSYFVSKVVFTLHPSFAEATREVTTTPFEVTEMGWGEFEAKMTLHFKDPSERPVDILHQLRLYPDASVTLTVKKPVVAESYDEVVFTDPHDDFYDLLMKGQTAMPVKKQVHQEHLTRFSEGDALQRLASAREWVHTKLGETKDKIRKADMEVTKLKSAIPQGAAPRGQWRPPTAQTRR